MPDERCFLEASNDIIQMEICLIYQISKLQRGDILSKRFLNFLHLSQDGDLFLGGKKYIYTQTYTERTHSVNSLKFIDTSKLRLEPLPA